MKQQYSRFQRVMQIISYMIIDASAIALTYVAAIIMFRVLNLDMSFGPVLAVLPFILVFKLMVYFMFGFYNMLVNHVGFEDALRIALVATMTNVAIVIYIAFSNNMFMFKSAFIFITPIEIMLLLTPRVINRIIGYVKINIDWNNALGRRTMIIGAGSAGDLVIKEIYRNKDLNNLPVAFLDDDPKKIGNRINNVKIVGPISKISDYIEKFRIEEIIIAIADYPQRKLQELASEITKKNVKLKKLMSLADMSDDDHPKIIDVKIEDLLNRDEIRLDNEGIVDFIKGEIVMVTGGGGSIGSELCRQIAELKPKQLIIFDIYENNAYEIQMELLRTLQKEHRDPEFELTVLIGSVYNLKRLEDVFIACKPTIVFHAAAYKHVPLMEDSAVEAVRTNIMGTYNTALLSNKYGIKKFVLVSSDKAVRSTNIMGATKRFAELIIQEQQTKSTGTKFTAVRFGNVLGSNGSVIPLFKKQIADGGPVTVTHKEITRYFMTIPEAVGLILQCAVFAEGGEVFILDMGEPVKIIDLAERMIRLTGLKPYEDIDIEFTGLRPGEKLYEEILVDHNHAAHKQTDNDKIFIEAQSDTECQILKLDKIFSTFEDADNEEVKQMISKIIKSYCVNGIKHP